MLPPRSAQELPELNAILRVATRSALHDRSPRRVVAIALLTVFAMFASLSARAVSTVALPERACWSLGLEILRQSGFENALPSLPATPSLGFGGDYPGDLRREVFIQSLAATRAYHVHLPPNYSPENAWPIVIVLHGQPPHPAYTEAYALFTLNQWAAVADARGFLVLAPIASGPISGGWNPPDDTAMVEAVLADVEGAYNINRARRYLWGFSSGGHYGHGYALSHASSLAAYAVNAGVLEGYAGPTAPAAATRKLPVSIRVGTFDSPAMLAAARRDPPRFTANGWVLDDNLKYTEFTGGHEYNAQELEAGWDFMCRFALGP